MLQTIKKIFSIEEVKYKIVFTLLMLVVCRIGAYIPVPGINGDEVFQVFRQLTGGSQNLFQLVDIFSGGAFAQMTVIALGVMPYISASIIMQILVAVVPSLQREIRENGDAGKKKMGKGIRLMTIVLALFQSALLAKYALSLNISHPGIIVPQLLTTQILGFPWLFFLIVMAAMSTGTLFLMWIGEQITERGIGNGISLIISVGILSSLPRTLGTIVRQLNLDSQEPGQMTFSSIVILGIVFVAIILGTILIIQGMRKIPLQYARRVVGRRESQGGSSHIPLKINYAGVIPVIFASSLLMFPATIAQFLSKGIMALQCGEHALSWELGIYNVICHPYSLFHILLDGNAISPGANRFGHEEKWSLYPRDPPRATYARIFGIDNESNHSCWRRILSTYCNFTNTSR